MCWLFSSIFSSSSFISIFFISSISNHLPYLNHSVIYLLFNHSISFISVSNLSISFIFFLVIFLNSNSSLRLFGLTLNLFFIAEKWSFLSNSSNSSIFYISNSFQRFGFVSLVISIFSISSSIVLKCTISNFFNLHTYFTWG